MSPEIAQLSAPDYGRYGTDYRTYLEHFRLYLQALKQMEPKIKRLGDSLCEVVEDLHLSENDWTVTESNTNAPPSGEEARVVESESSGSSGVSTPTSSAMKTDKKHVEQRAFQGPRVNDPEPTTGPLLVGQIPSSILNPWVPAVRTRSPKTIAATTELTSRYSDKISGKLHHASDACSFADIVAYLDDVAQPTVIEQMARQSRLPNTWGSLGNLRDQLIRVQKQTFKDPSKKVRVKDLTTGIHPNA